MSKKMKGFDVSNNATSHSELRKAAEKFIADNLLLQTSIKDTEIREIFQDLQIHQIELEMQNNELHHTNIELEKEKSKFAAIFNLAPVGYFLLDHAGVIKDVNDAGMNLLAISRAKILGRRLDNFVSKSSAEDYIRFLSKILHSEQSQQCAIELNSDTEKKFYVQAQGITKHIGNSQSECLIALIDITDRIKAEAQLADVKDRLELSLKASLAGIWELDIQSMNFSLDEGSQRICQIPPGGFDGKFTNFLKIIHPDDRERVRRLFQFSLSSHKEIDLTCRFGNKGDKECYAVIRGHLIPVSESKQRFAGIILDTTEKTLMEKSSFLLRDDYQKRIASAMINAEQNERKRISEALHDSVSQLLYGIKIHLGQLENDLLPSSNVKTVRTLLDQAIEETRNISFELAPSILTDFGLPATIEELVKRLSSKDLQMNVKIKGLFKRMDLLLETNIYRIIQELINNSMKHSSATRIDIEISKGKSIEITVKDNGKGYDVKEQEGSTAGSGLSSIKNRLRIYNGSLTVNSEPAKGTTVHVRLFEEPGR